MAGNEAQISASGILGRDKCVDLESDLLVGELETHERRSDADGTDIDIGIGDLFALGRYSLHQFVNGQLPDFEAQFDREAE